LFFDFDLESDATTKREFHDDLKEVLSKAIIMPVWAINFIRIFDPSFLIPKSVYKFSKKIMKEKDSDNHKNSIVKQLME